LEEALVVAEGAEDVLGALVSTFEDFLGEGPTPAVMFYEMTTLAQRNPEIAAELAELGRSTRSHLADALKAKQGAGRLELRVDPDAAALFLFALADGVTMRRLSEPGLDITPLMDQAISAARSVFV
jgi:hypothetical protein